MSRCFPFPPPGYEKEARTYDLDLLKKEKDKERKLKKEKKNREKKESKDKGKKEKDRRKEKKEKHRDKKEKDRDKGKDKIILDDNRLPKQVELISADKAPDENKLQLPSRSRVNTGEIFSLKETEREIERNNFSGDKKSATHISGYDKWASQNSQFSEPPKDSKHLQQADKGIRDEARGTNKKAVEKFRGADAKKDEGVVRSVAKSTGVSSHGMERVRTSEGRKSYDQSVKNGLNFIGNITSQSSPGIVPHGINNTLKPFEKDGDKRIEGKEKCKEKELDDRQGDRSKEKEVWQKDKDRDKEKKKEEKAKSKSQQKKTETDKLKEIGKDDIISGICNVKTSQIPKEGINHPSTEVNPKKRKDLDTNGFLNGNDIKRSKVPKPASSHPLIPNGKASGTSSPVLLGRLVAVNKLQTDGKERRINDIRESPASTVSSTTPTPSVVPLTTLPPSIPTKPLITTAKVDPLSEPPRKLPHPDSKYLNVVLAVPKMEEWSDYDDQEWLFQGSDSQSKKAKEGSFKVDEIPQVWSEALQIESADVCALPYVIPY